MLGRNFQSYSQYRRKCYNYNGLSLKGRLTRQPTKIKIRDSRLGQSAEKLLAWKEGAFDPLIGYLPSLPPHTYKSITPPCNIAAVCEQFRPILAKPGPTQ